MKKIIFILSVTVCYFVSAQGIRSLNGSQVSTQKTIITYDDTASYFRWGMSNGIHTLYVPYNLSPTIDTGGISSLNGLVTSTQAFAVDTTYSTSPVFVSSGSTHTFRFPMSRINNKLNIADSAKVSAGYGISVSQSSHTATVTADSSVLMTKGTRQTVSAPKDYTARQNMTSLAVDTIDDKSGNGVWTTGNGYWGTSTPTGSAYVSGTKGAWQGGYASGVVDSEYARLQLGVDANRDYGAIISSRRDASGKIWGRLKQRDAGSETRYIEVGERINLVSDTAVASGIMRADKIYLDSTGNTINFFYRGVQKWVTALDDGGADFVSVFDASIPGDVFRFKPGGYAILGGGIGTPSTEQTLQINADTGSASLYLTDLVNSSMRFAHPTSGEFRMTLGGAGQFLAINGGADLSQAFKLDASKNIFIDGTQFLDSVRTVTAGRVYSNSTLTLSQEPSTGNIIGSNAVYNGAWDDVGGVAGQFLYFGIAGGAEAGKIYLGSTSSAGSPTVKFTFNTSTGNAIIGNQTGSTATPNKIDMALDYSNGTTRDKLKFYLYNSGTEQYGFGVGGSSDVQYHSNGTHDSYVANTKITSVASTGLAVTGYLTTTTLSDLGTNAGTATIGAGDSVQVTVTGLTTATGAASVSYKRTGATATATADTIASYNINVADKITLYGKFGWLVSYVIGKK